jgi:hypothetical protein
MYLPKLKGAHILVISIVFLSVTVFCLGLVKGVSYFRPVSAQTDKRQADNNPKKLETVGKSRENMISKKISALLFNQEITFDEAKLLPNQVAESRTFHIRLESATVDSNSTKSGLSESKLETSSVKLLETKNRRQSVSRQRAFELSPTQLLVIYGNEQKQVLWWELQPDPRIFRAETSDESGNLSGKTLYRAGADMLITFPADEKIAEVFLYSPNWDGKNYNLELIGRINLLDNQKVK